MALPQWIEFTPEEEALLEAFALQWGRTGEWTPLDLWLDDPKCHGPMVHCVKCVEPAEWALAVKKDYQDYGFDVDGLGYWLGTNRVMRYKLYCAFHGEIAYGEPLPVYPKSAPEPAE